VTRLTRPGGGRRGLVTRDQHCGGHLRRRRPDRVKKFQASEWEPCAHLLKAAEDDFIVPSEEEEDEQEEEDEGGSDETRCEPGR
jgi:hypothetical protein